MDFVNYNYLFFNFRNRVYLGDGGVYLVSFITSVILIKFINKYLLTYVCCPAGGGAPIVPFMGGYKNQEINF